MARFIGRNTLQLLLAVYSMWGGASCYTYRPVTTPPKLSERVRVTLTSEGTVDLARFLGPRVVIAEGAVASIRPDNAMVVAVDFVQTADGVRQPWSGEGLVTFPAAHVAAMSQRTFLRRQSYLAGAAGAAALVAAALIALKNSGSGTGGGNPPPPPP
jgi:hypothetical protein